VISGDNEAAVWAVADAVGIRREDAFGGQLPADKAEAVRLLQAEGQVVVMAGDGVNDAPALAQADVGMALSHGMDAAGEAADVVLIGERIGQVADTIELGRATFDKIKQNLVWALGYNLVGIPLAAGVLLPAYEFSLNPSTAGAMMAVSSIAVVSNSVLLRFHNPARPTTR
ncbi:P-type ATPase, partial [Cymbomonas tetramitiformis]